MNRTRMFAALLVVLFLAAVGVGYVTGQEDESAEMVAVSVREPTTTAVERPATTRPQASTTTTTRAPATTTTRPAPVTTIRPRVTITVYVPTTSPTTTAPPTTEPPPPTVTTTIAPTYDPILCAQINSDYDRRDEHDNPERVALLKSVGCPPHYWT